MSVSKAAVNDQEFSEKLADARKYETLNAINESDRPLFHVTPAVGWMNDPNGFSVYDGKVHLFYQYHPYSTEWGPMHWGHQVSEDMIKWEQLPVAMAPDTEYDAEGCFSGTAIEKDGKHVLIYTSVMKKDRKELHNESSAGDEDMSQIQSTENDGEALQNQSTENDGEALQNQSIENDGGVLQNQSIVVGDGVTYRKIQGNPVVTGDMLPEGLSRADFRDPKVWYEDGQYYMAAGGVDQDNRGLVVLFSSPDMNSWTFVNILARNTGDLGGVWECPDFFKLGDSYVLLVSPICMKADGYEFHSGNNSVYFVGKFDNESGKFDGEKAVSIDYGTDFYAPQTTLLPDGRRIMIAWMQSWHNLWIPNGQRWQGMMTLPREITLEDGRLIQKPVREIEKYYADTVVYSKETICGKRVFEGISGRFADMTVVVRGNEYDEFTVELAKGSGYSTIFTYRRRKGLIELDRSLAGFERDVVCIRKARMKKSMIIAHHTSRDFCAGIYSDGKSKISGAGAVETYSDGSVVSENAEMDMIKLRFILDRNSIELFVNDGSMTMSTVIYTPIDAAGIEFTCDGCADVDIEKHDLI